MKCPLETAGRKDPTTDLLLDYSAGRLNKANAVIVRNHIATCGACSAFQMEQTELWEALDAWQPEPVSTDFDRRLWQRIDLLASEPWYMRVAEAIRFGAWKPAFPLAVAVVVMVAGFTLDHQRTVHSSPARVSIGEAEQVEKTLDDIQLLRQFDSVTNSRTM